MSKDSNIGRRRKNALAEGNPEYKAKRDELVQLAANLFKEKGFKATTLNDIALHSGLERATLYYYIISKEELFQEVAKGVLDKNIAEAQRFLRMKDLNPREKLERLFEMLMVSYEAHYPHMYVYIQEQMHEVGRDATPWAQEMVKQTLRFEKVVMKLISEGIEQGIFRNDISVRIATNGLFGMFNWTHRWFKTGGKLTAKEIADMFNKIFFDGLAVQGKK